MSSSDRRTLRIAIAQLNLVVGDVLGNTTRVLETAAHARDELGAQLVVFPELTLCGYPPEDLLLHRGFRKAVQGAVAQVQRALSGIAVLVGYPEYEGDRIYNAAALISDGRLLASYRKQLLPNYGVFDEKRYFSPGDQPCVVPLNGIPLGITICEDIWQPGPAEQSSAAGAKLLLNLNASPFNLGKHGQRRGIVRERIASAGVPMVYVNLVGGQDELVFDGRSLVMDDTGQLVMRARDMQEGVFPVDFSYQDGRVVAHTAEVAAEPEQIALAYRALVSGVRDYVDKHGFPGVVIGLSGGIDSSLTLAIAVDALGADRVRTVQMPSRYTADISVHDSAEQSRRQGVQHDVISIEPAFKTLLEVLAPQFEGLAPDTTEENLQARCRGIILMALSNKTGRIVLTTGNKSEMAVGYATLYGDMAGGFAPIKDCSKTLVYALARYRNTLGEVIPVRVIERPPSAELREDQQDTDSLPPYDILDAILEAFIEENCSVEDIVGRGFDKAIVVRVLNMVRRNEYKRRQAPPGVRVSPRAFGRDWRYPITSGYRPGQIWPER